MLLLLPPSETKRLGGDPGYAQDRLARHAALGTPREQVRLALVEASADEETAVRALKLGVKNRDERLRNLELETSGVMPAIERYTGVLYDALEVQSAAPAARAWIDAHVAIQSSLFGLCDAGDPIPAYRLSASSRLPALGLPLAKLWAPAHAGALSSSAYALDLRSKDYAALAPLASLGATHSDTVEVVTRSSGGEVRALNHFNKAAKGDLVRRLAASGPELASRGDLLAWAEDAGLELLVTEDGSGLRLVTALGAPAATS